MAAELTPAEQQVIDAVNRAKANGKWMIAVWSMNHRAQLQKDIVTHDFPMNAFQNAKEDLSGFISEQVPARETRILPAADLGLFQTPQPTEEQEAQAEAPNMPAPTLIQKAIEFPVGGPGEEGEGDENAQD